MTTPKAILIGLTFIAVAIASIPYSNNVVTPALASGHVQKVAICTPTGGYCADIFEIPNPDGRKDYFMGVHTSVDNN